MNANILRSAEVRWIIEGEAPQVVRDWFAHDKKCKAEGPRVDYYWNVPNCEFTGIKLRKYPEANRNSNLEFKPLVQIVREFVLPDGVHGQVDVWDKWSTDGQAAVELSALLGERKDVWLAIRKLRWLRKYSADQGSATKVGASERPTDGCNVEYTELRAGAVGEIAEDKPNTGRPFWTIGFEAFNDENRVIHILREALAAEFTAADCPSELKQFLRAETSFNYPQWVTCNSRLGK